MVKRKKLICVTGLPGAGKSLFCEIGKRLGYELIIMGNQVRKEAENRGVDNDSESLSRLMLELRKERGNNAVANMCIDKINEKTNENIIIDGIRNIEEIELFTEIGDVKIVLISNTSEQRMKFLLERKRSDAPIDIEEFNQRDSKELEIGLGQVMERADIIIENVELTKEEYTKKTESILHNLM